MLGRFTEEAATACTASVIVACTMFGWQMIRSGSAVITLHAVGSRTVGRFWMMRDPAPAFPQDSPIVLPSMPSMSMMEMLRSLSRRLSTSPSTVTKTLSSTSRGLSTTVPSKYQLRMAWTPSPPTT